MKKWIATSLSLLLTSCASYKADKTYKVQNEVKYGAHERQRGDLYLSDLPKAPLVITIHGGSWKSRSHHDMTVLAESLASHGYNVFNMSYRFAPEFNHPAPIDDLALVLKFLKKNYEDKMDLNNIGLWGYSAGAHIALMYGLKDNKNKIKSKKIRAVVGGGGPYDFTWWPGSPLITPYMGYEFQENIQGWLDASPISHLHSDAPSLFLYNGKEDDLVHYGQMTSLAARAKLKGIDVETHLVEFWGHATTFIFSKEAVKKGILFLNKKLQ